VLAFAAALGLGIENRTDMDSHEASHEIQLESGLAFSQAPAGAL